MGQRAGDAARFGVEVEHGRFEVVVAEDDLQVANESAAMQGMGGDATNARQAHPEGTHMQSSGLFAFFRVSVGTVWR